MRRSFLIALLIVLGLPLMVALYSFLESRRMPVVREATIALPDWPKGAKPIDVVLIADIHIGNASTGPWRLNAAVDRINALKPDLVLIAGDLIFGHDPHMAARVGGDLGTALGRLQAPLGTVAVFGNHDIWTGPSDVEAALKRAHVTLLRNDAVRRGPVAIAGVDDPFTHHEDIGRSWSRARALGGATVVLSHSPDIDVDLPPEARLLLAGHSHCGQVFIPGYGALVAVTRDRKSCGLSRMGALRVIVTAGLGTSGLPFRLNAPPDLWLLHLRPATPDTAS